MDQRKALLAEVCEDFSLSVEEVQERFGPGSFGNHEAVDRIYLVSHTWETHVGEHPAILLDPVAFEKAQRVSELMEELYQYMGQKD